MKPHPISNPVCYPEFNNRVALVTGARQGIGQALAQRLSCLGAVVIELDHGFTPEETGPQRFNIDVSDPVAVADVVALVESTFGDIEFAVSVAGILRLGSLLECSAADWHDSFAVNATGAFHVCQTIARRMALRKRGSLVIVSSNAARIPRLNMGCYAASKAALSQFARCLALELAQYHVRCNIVAPGATETPMQKQLWNAHYGPAEVVRGDLEKHRIGIPLGSIAQVDDIANTILFLLSSQSQHITMETITIDGGATLGQ